MPETATQQSQSPALSFPELADLLGERYTESAFERNFYASDLAAIPPLLAAALGRRAPQAIARPQSIAEVATIVCYAASHRVPVTPRAAASTTYWNVVPVHGGLVLDLNGLRGMVAVDKDRLIATVLPGTRWQELDSALLRHGCAVCAYPTSAPGATVGGWLSMEGHGIGSLKYGGPERQVLSLEVVLPDGRVVTATAASDPPLSWFLGAEGTLGIITKVELAIRPAPAAVGQHLLKLPDMQSLQEAALALATGTPTPYTIRFGDAAYCRMLAQAKAAPAIGRPTTSQALAGLGAPFLAITYQGEQQEVKLGAEAVQRALARFGGTDLGEDLAVQEWKERFAALRLKRAGPTLLGAEFWLPLGRLAAYHRDVACLMAERRLTIATYGTVVAPDKAVVMSVYPCDERHTVAYLLALGLTKRLYSLAFRHGGRPYGLGFWNTPYLRWAFAPEELAERRKRKRHLDPFNLMNPGKMYAPSFFLLRPSIFEAGMDVLAWLHREMCNLALIGDRRAT